MKKIIFCAVLLCTIAFVANAQTALTNAQIDKIVNQSKEANLTNGVIDPNKIKPGQTLTFMFENGAVKTITVEEGDSQWKILRDKLPLLIQQNGGVVDYDKSKEKVGSSDPVGTAGPSDESNALPWWMWVLIAIGIVALIVLVNMYTQGEKEAKKDPVTSGTPMHASGPVSDEHALGYMQEVARRQFSDQNITVTKIEHGTLSGVNVLVSYAGELLPKRRTFANVPAYRGQVRVGNATEERTAYFLQGCGNDARMGNYFTGANIQFTPDPVQSPALSVTPTVEANTQAVPEPSATENALSVTPEEITLLVNALTEPMKEKDNGKITITFGNAKVEMEFSKVLIAQPNGAQAVH